MRRERSKTHADASGPRRSRRIHDEIHDTYGQKGKLREPTACSGCGAVYRVGRWQWGTAPADAHRTLCPACHRVRDDYPAGVIRISGAFARGHRSELVSMARHVESAEKAEHALKRIAKVADAGDDFEISTTDAKLAEAIGRHLVKAYAGELSESTGDPKDVVRLRWHRD